jgi:hypothetical protein
MDYQPHWPGNGNLRPYFVNFIYFVLLEWASTEGGRMDEKTITAVSTSLALMQIQVNALLLLLERHTPGVPMKEEFQQLISEGVQTVGLETMEGIKSRIYEGIVQQEEKDKGNGHH